MTNVVITGSTRGLGFFMGREFLKSGCNVTFSGRGNAPSDSLMSIIDQYRTQIIYVPVDVRSKTSIENLWAESVKKWGR